MIPLQTFVGAALLILGRKLFWVFVGAIGFVLGMDIASRFLQGRPDWLILIVALGAGVLGALLALFLQRACVYSGESDEKVRGQGEIVLPID